MDKQASSGSFDLSSLHIDWDLATKRLRKDIDDDFWPDPLSFNDFLREGMKTTIQDAIGSAYDPWEGAPYEVPKENYATRSAIYLTFWDRLAYQGIIDKLADEVDSRINSSVFSFRLQGSGRYPMFKPAVQQFKDFQNSVAEALKKNDAAYVVVTDLSHYFESIKFAVLKDQLNDLVPSLGRVVDVLNRLLARWSPYDHAGLPQNVDASSLLGNAMLHCVDEHMKRDGFVMFRYVDDIRIVTESEGSARQALCSLVKRLRELGLFINSAKTEILGPSASKMKDHRTPYDPEIARIEALIGQKTRASIDEAIPKLHAKVTQIIQSERRDERKMRYCLNRLHSLKRYKDIEIGDLSEICGFVLTQLIKNPSQAETYCKFLGFAGLANEYRQEIVRLLTKEPRIIYPWQLMHMWRLAIRLELLDDELIRKARSSLREDASDPAVGAAALYLGALGNSTDREEIARRIDACGEHFSARCHYVAVQQSNPRSRNKVYSKVSRGRNRYLPQCLKELASPRYCSLPEPLEIEELPDAMPSSY